ncbi:MAG TPA: GAF domain-containing sensor histidine kinase [Candidatus Acidoferrum sp.]|nr:GAF domain-containing sensor histidine kinase [Candidatus Acidoferrum sp.]
MPHRPPPRPTAADHPERTTERVLAIPTAEALEALHEAVRAIAGVLDVERVLQLIVDRIRPLVGARYAALGIVDPGGAYLERFITSGLTRPERDAIGALPRGHGILGLIIDEGRSFLIPDIAVDERRAGFPPNHPPMHSFLGVPVTIRGRPMGNFYLTEKQGAPEFSAADQRLVEMFALHAAIAIDNARLHEQVQRLAVVVERDRIGRDLHDGIIQAIYGVGLSLEDMPELIAADPDEAAGRVDRAIESLNLVIRDIRNFIVGLRPEQMETAGLIAGLTALADESRLNTTIDVELSSEGVDGLELPEDRRGQLFQVAREALSNVARHASATRAVLRLERDADMVVLTISDNGVGFDAAIQPGPGHRGLINMADRVTALRGEMNVDSRPGAGTRLTVRVPIPDPATDEAYPVMDELGAR